MNIEQKINYQLNKCPWLKKIIKRIYQRIMYFISKKMKSEGDINCLSPQDREHEYFFGYYDKSPWDINDRYVLCLRVKNTWKDVSPKDKAEIILIDTLKNKNDISRIRKLGETSSWNVQQGCMLQWLGPDYNSKIIYNDFRNKKFCSVILNIDTLEEEVINAPIYSVSNDGKIALTLDFTRLYSLRPGYGYYNEIERTKGIGLPNEDCIWLIDLENNIIKPILDYKDFANFVPRIEMQGDEVIHKVNHIMLNPEGKRFMVLYRWFNKNRKYTRLITCNIDGSDMYLLSDEDMVSHCCWKNNEEILAFANKYSIGTGYYLMKDKTNEYIHCWPQLTNDGHPSYSPNREFVVTDTYPNRARISEIKVMSGNEKEKKVTVKAKVFSPFKYDNDTRCDLHPRWNRKGDKICFDSVYEGKRRVYCLDIKREGARNGRFSKCNNTNV